ncbi:DUF899 domain-containing protein [Bacillus gobiensis]|uniref:DUF899 domain-containing protein n=1 Tax=Bacillus gobiensis TaxID=1441095 RepID=UPI003D190530
MKTRENNSQLPSIVSREEWLVARKNFLDKEKEFTLQRDRLNAERRNLPMVQIDKNYVFEGSEGETNLLRLFDGRNQLIVYHFMLDPTWEEGCTNCSFVVDNFGHLSHLHAYDTSLVLVSRAPLAKIDAFKKRMGWNVPWVSSFGSDFNYDFHVTMDESVAPVMYNYLNKEELEQKGETWFLKGEQPGVSVFLRDGNNIYHTYSAYTRGLDLLMTTYNYLDLTPMGRNESIPGEWVRHHDRYQSDSQNSECSCRENDS